MSKNHEDARAEQRRKGLELMAAAQVAGATVEVKPSNEAEAKIYNDALTAAWAARRHQHLSSRSTSHARPRERRSTTRTTRSTSSSSDDPDPPGEPGDAGLQAVGHLAADLLEGSRDARGHARSALALRCGPLAEPVLARGIVILDDLIDDLEDLVSLALEVRS